jgi:electron transport complex protein RnfG
MNKGILLPVLSLLLAVVILLGVSFGLKGVAESKAQAEHLRLLRTVLPDSENFVVEPYAGDDANIVSVHKGENGFVVETSTYGYAGDITMYIGVSNEGKVTGLVVNTMSETPGLGGEALTDHVFLSQFLNQSGSFTVATHGADAFSSATGETAAAEGEEIEVDAITGATVTSKAVARSVSSAVAYVTGADVASSATTWGG